MATGARVIAINGATARFLCCEVIGDACQLLFSVRFTLQFVRRIDVWTAAYTANSGPWATARGLRVEVRVLRADIDE
jgi:hypothetical protein